MVMRSPSSTSGNSSSTVSTPMSLEIKPDIDYFALTHRQQRPPGTGSTRSPASGPPIVPPRSLSLTRNLTQGGGAIRRSLSLFKSNPPPDPPQPVRSRRPSYHEIVVHGYGNGTNSVSVSIDGFEIDNLLPRSPSSSSTSSTGSSTERSEAKSDSSASAPESPGTEDSLGTAGCGPEQDTNDPPRGRQPVRFDAVASRKESGLPAPAADGVYSTDGLDLSPAVPLRSNARKYHSLYGAGQLSALRPSPLRILKEASVGELPDDPDAWHRVGDTAQQNCEKDMTQANVDDIQPEWEQFADLGGHTVLPAAKGEA